MIADDVVVTVLTGGRPALLADTLAAVREHADGLLDAAHVIALNNGGDDATREVLDGHADVIDEVRTTEPMLHVGPATSRLARAARTAGRRWWLHLEDDWRAHPSGDWLDAAFRIFATDPQVSQVRLRLADEPVLSRHMVTRETIRWRDRDGYRITPDAHWTNNPALMRAAHAGDAWPSESERTAQRRWRAAGHRAVGQLVPGVFAHTGGEQSLRLVTGSPV